MAYLLKLNMPSIASLLILLLNLGVCFYNCRSVIKRRTRPALAMWLFFSIAVTGTLVTYLKEEPDRGFMDNIFNASDVLVCSVCTVVIFFRGDKSTRFNRFDLYCLTGVLLIAAFWLVSQNHLVANLAIQGIIVIAYFPVAARLWRSAENSESFLVWGGLFAIALLGLYDGKGLLAKIYALRAAVCTLGLMLLMLRAELRAAKAAHKLR